MYSYLLLSAPILNELIVQIGEISSPTLPHGPLPKGAN